MNHASIPLWQDANTDEKVQILKGLIDDLYRYVLGDAVSAVIEILENHVPADEKEEKDIDMILQLCRKNPNILNANCEVGHITGSALIVDPANKQVLLNYHPKFDKWLQFGGHPEYEKAPWRVALREAQEESGLSDLAFFPDTANPKPLDIDAHMIQAKGKIPQHYHLDFRYLFVTQRYEDAKASVESKEIKWVPFRDLSSMTLDPALARLIRKSINILGLSTQ